VVGIADGDTLTILDSAKRQHKVRLADIDAPEKGRAFGDASKRPLSALCFGRQAAVDDSAGSASYAARSMGGC
jgi:micrococcal nuclease